MTDFEPKTLTEVLEIISEAQEQCPESAMEAYEALISADDYKIYTLSAIAKNQDEPWAAQVAGDWLKENGYT